MSQVIAVDTEVFYSSKLKHTLKLQIAEQFCRSHLFDCYMVSVSDGTTCWSGHPRELNWDALQGKTLVSHNAYWDQTCYEEMVRRGQAPQIKFEAWHCSANLSAYLCNRRALDAAVEHLFNVKISKTARSDANGKQWPKDFSEKERADMMEYARGDAFWCWKIWNDFSPRWPEHERRLSKMTIDQGKRGVQIDRELLDKYILETHAMKMATEGTIPWIRDADDEAWEEFNAKPTSTKCIAEECRRSGIPAPPVKSEDEEAYEEWETQYSSKHTWIKSISAWRSINKLYKTFITVKERLRDDGTMPFSLKYFGAHTGRWSGDAKVNMQNMRKKPMLCNEFGLLETNDKRSDSAIDTHSETGVWPEWVKSSIDFRALITPRPGKFLITSDLSQVEPRVLAWCAGDFEFLEIVRRGISVYQAHAEATMGWPKGVPMDKKSEQYKLAKARILALGYGAGWEKFIAMAWTLARLDITKDDPEWIEVPDPVTGEVKKISGYGSTSKKIVEQFRADNPRIAARYDAPAPGLWHQLDDAFKRSIGSDFTLRLPSGRAMRYEKVRCDVRIEKDKETGKPRRKSVFTANSDGRRKSFYGGKLVENLVQATARDVFAEHMLRVQDRGWTVLFHVHDELIVEVDETVTVEDIEREMSYCPEWLSGCPLAAEAHKVERYTK
jgi:hypothetical protein